MVWNRVAEYNDQLWLQLHLFRILWLVFWLHSNYSKFCDSYTLISLDFCWIMRLLLRLRSTLLESWRLQLWLNSTPSEFCHLCSEAFSARLRLELELVLIWSHEIGTNFKYTTPMTPVPDSSIWTKNAEA